MSFPWRRKKFSWIMNAESIFRETYPRNLKRSIFPIILTVNKALEGLEGVVSRRSLFLSQINDELSHLKNNNPLRDIMKKKCHEMTFLERGGTKRC